jgi:AcrR family transcriptional regulator
LSSTNPAHSKTTSPADAKQLLRGHRHGRVPRLIRKEQLLDIAEELFVTKGLAATSIEDIAGAAGVTRPIIYKHFGTKEGVYLECVHRARATFEETLLATAGTTDDPQEQLTRGATALFTLLEREPLRWKLLFASSTLLPREYASQLEQLRFTTIDRIGELLRQVLPTASPERVAACAHAISGIGERLGHWWLANPQMTRQELTEHFRAVTWPIIEAQAEST